MTVLLVSLIIGATLWLVLFILSMLFSEFDVADSVGAATGATFVLALLVGIAAGASWLIYSVVSA